LAAVQTGRSAGGEGLAQIQLVIYALIPKVFSEGEVF